MRRRDWYGCFCWAADDWSKLMPRLCKCDTPRCIVWSKLMPLAPPDFPEYPVRVEEAERHSDEVGLSWVCKEQVFLVCRTKMQVKRKQNTVHSRLIKVDASSVWCACRELVCSALAIDQSWCLASVLCECSCLPPRHGFIDQSWCYHGGLPSRILVDMAFGIGFKRRLQKGHRSVWWSSQKTGIVWV